MEITQQLIRRTLLHPAGTRAILRVILPATVLAGNRTIQVHQQARTDRVTQAAIVATRRHLAPPVADFRPVTLHHQATVHHRATVPRLATVLAHRTTAHPYAIILHLRQGTIRPTASTIIKFSEYYSSANKEKRHSNLPHTFCLNNGIDFGLYDSILCVRVCA